MLNSIGADTEATLVHMHPGNVPQKQALLALKLPLEQQQRCISVNLYSVLREFYQGDKSEASVTPIAVEAEEETRKDEHEALTDEQTDTVEPTIKKFKLDESPNGR